MSEVEITQGEFPGVVRLRKGMYISSLNQMITEIVDNSTDEYLAGYCDTIAISVIDDIVTVQDNGRGVNVNPSKKPGISQAELAYTSLHAGGKFGISGGYTVKTLSGMHGVGGSCVNALSELMTVIINKEDNEYQIDFQQGITINKLHVNKEKINERLNTGTTVIFKADKGLWNDQYYDFPKLIRRIKELAYLNPGLTFYLNIDSKDENGKKVEYNNVIHEPEGLKSYLTRLTSNKDKVIDIVSINETVKDKVEAVDPNTGNINETEIDIEIECHFCYTDSYSDNITTFCNNSSTVEVGSHYTGFIAGLSNAVKEYTNLNNMKLNFENRDLLEGITCVLSVKLPDPNFDGQNKQKLEMPIVRKAVKKIISDKFLEYLDFNKEKAASLINKIDIAIKAREAVKKAKESVRKHTNKTPFTSTKIAHCTCKDPKLCEIRIVEGDSAGGSEKQGRDRRFQAIYPSWGKINNTEKEKSDTVFTNEKIMPLVTALGCGYGEDFNIDKLMYDKIILDSDADVDGYHINCLWITFFFRHMPQIIKQGHLYVSCPPLYKVTLKNNEIYYLKDDAALNKFRAEHKNISDIQRFKGLGEMNPDQLWDTILNPDNRTLIQVTTEDAEAAEEIITILMGEKVLPRREYILENTDFSMVQ